MKAVIFNFGNPGKINSSTEYTVNYINEKNASLNDLGITKHYDPDLVHWLFGDYPSKSMKGKLKHLGLGDYIFFTTTLHGKGFPNTQYFIAAMELASVKTLKELIAHKEKIVLQEESPFCFHPHIQRFLYTEVQEDENCTFYLGNLEESFILKEILPLNYNLVREIFQRFPAKAYNHSELYNWYYNNPHFLESFGVSHDINGKLLTDSNLIGSKFRNIPLLPPELTEWLLEALQNRKKLRPDDYIKYNIQSGKKIIL